MAGVGTQKVFENGNMSPRITILNAVILLAPGFVFAADWTQWAGNDRQCTWNESGVLEEFPETGLKPTWSVPIGSGYSGPVVSEGRVFVTDYR